MDFRPLFSIRLKIKHVRLPFTRNRSLLFKFCEERSKLLNKDSFQEHLWGVSISSQEG